MQLAVMFTLSNAAVLMQASLFFSPAQSLSVEALPIPKHWEAARTWQTTCVGRRVVVSNVRWSIPGSSPKALYKKDENVIARDWIYALSARRSA